MKLKEILFVIGWLVLVALLGICVRNSYNGCKDRVEEQARRAMRCEQMLDLVRPDCLQSVPQE